MASNSYTMCAEAQDRLAAYVAGLPMLRHLDLTDAELMAIPVEAVPSPMAREAARGARANLGYA